MARLATGLLALFCASAAAGAQEGGVSFGLEGTAERQVVVYDCRAGEAAQAREMAVEYVNLPGSTFAVLPVEGRPTLFVGVIAAAGAKYASGPYVWWTKGPRGDLMDERVGDPARSVVCRVRR